MSGGGGKLLKDPVQSSKQSKNFGVPKGANKLRHEERWRATKEERETKKNFGATANPKFRVLGLGDNELRIDSI
jgi:hypothetical protein